MLRGPCQRVHAGARVGHTAADAADAARPTVAKDGRGHVGRLVGEAQDGHAHGCQGGDG